MMNKQYWADAATQNCVWLFQTKRKEYGEDGCICGYWNHEEGEAVEGKQCSCRFEYWETENVFLTREEANEHGEARPYAWGNKGEGWRIYGVQCIGLMAELLGKSSEISELILIMKEAFNLEISDVEEAKLKTIDDMVNYIKDKKGE